MKQTAAERAQVMAASGITKFVTFRRARSPWRLRRLLALVRLTRRVIRYYWTGAYMSRVHTSRESIAQSMMPRFKRLMRLLRDPNLVHPLTPIVIALRAGRAHPHREAHYSHAFQRRTNFRRGVPAKLVGRPQLTKYPSLNVYSDVEWAPGYVTRKQKLAARRTIKAFKGVA